MNVLSISRFIVGEVERQGYKLGTHEFSEMCANMGIAWMWALRNLTTIDLDAVLNIGGIVHPEANMAGFRRVPVWIGGEKQGFERLQERLEDWVKHIPNLTPDEAYVYFEEIHPFIDGNGRTGKIIFNYLNGTLDDPVLPKVPAHWRIP